MKSTLIFLSVLLLPLIGFSQEFNANITVNGERVQTNETQIFTELQNQLQQFMLNQEWTDDRFEDNEKIKLNIQITLGNNSDVTNQSYQADVQIQSTRPVYNASYESTLINFLDPKWSFTYNNSDRLVYTRGIYTTEIVSLLSFYSYIVLGMDYDSFSLLGGTQYYEKALEIANYSEQNGRPGWSAFGDKRDRYYLARDFMDPQFENFRKFLYTYHRLGLDIFNETPDEARLNIIQGLNQLKGVRKAIPISVTMDVFFAAKGGEIANIFAKGTKEQADEVGKILLELDPSRAQIYKKLLTP
ncbi:type IX secretion system protein PorD [Flammeovirga pacifica]|uniref:DUF4835 domain-containing protein n=1 Tax=Flammeovirga pacifica TaxID=915059 RepID=A0A1S1Z4Y1_FLAPC|nr:DUF4835 family protein [Flammeovirga pacifica]OHX68348.1 hypothetical protein NH26_19340 [Flammeovirga pacifica]